VLYDRRRLILVAGGERAGKSFVSGLFGTTRTPFGDTFWIVGPDYMLARPEFDYWTTNLIRLGAIGSDRDISRPKLGACIAITKTGQTIETKTSDDTMKLAAVAPSGIIMAEAAQHDYDSYLRCVGRVAEKRGWLLMSGTFEGSQGWYADKFGEWQDPLNIENGVSYSMPSWSNSAIYPGGREDPEILRLERLYQRVEGLFEERIGANPVPSSTLVFREFRQSVHVNPKIVYDSRYPVYLAIDPSSGTNPYAVLFCQFIKHEREEAHPDPIDYCNVIDELYVSNRIGEELMAMAKEKPFWDAVRGGAIDVEAPDEKKRWLKYNHIHLWSDKVHQLAGIRRLKSFLHYTLNPATGKFVEPTHLQIHPRCKGLIYELGHYKRPQAKDDDHEVRDMPEANQADHSVKALWYLLIARYGEVKASYVARPAYNWHRRK